ncbi:hypothetical protein QFC20_004963 [Naganishia adeliensis]|uniref:Uncharacterized protein n=1 Tax=Naganishia adeliensis TaxID=92952 RepID=A0ACC2VV70_9TREE|nr:hypothetical protein QFC20_004963 [Naganishia adeliensis]
MATTLPSRTSHLTTTQHTTRPQPPRTSQTTTLPAPTPSGSHLADQLGDFAAWITINGQLCRAYEGVTSCVPHPGGNKNVVKCLMGVDIGRNFEIHVDTTGYVTRRATTLMHRKPSPSSGKPSSPDKPSIAVDLSAEPDLEVRLSIDGRWVGTHVVGAAAVDRVTTFRGAAISDAMLRKFRFVPGERTATSRPTITPALKPPSTPAPKQTELGTIKISIHRVRRGEPTSAWIPGKLNMHRNVPEHYGNGVVTYYDQEIVLPRPERYFIVRRLPEDKTQPLCSFEIAYRSLAQLSSMGIVPHQIVLPAREVYHVPPHGKPGTANYRRGVDVVLVAGPPLPAGTVTTRAID